ncbi:GFA family protein [Thalassovita sp.]|uniref:GFA family protein n=1 Tax=Thalassovita sp. TaxID=1979401 RepID=UPI002B27A781|nr:GFA family protein [Thalassovita sp.]
MKRGSCLCGRVHYETEAEFGPATACHCSQCRKITGSYSIAAPVPTASVIVIGDPRWFVSSPGTRRGFCPDCGSYLFWEEGDGLIWVSLGTVDGPTGTRVENHIFCAYKGDYQDQTDAVPHYREGWSSEEIE